MSRLPWKITGRDVPAAAKNLGRAWVALTLALALHVADEATHDFLSVYNPSVAAIRARLPFLPLPTFTFPVWITGLALAILGLLALSPLAFRGNRWIRRLAFPFAVLMFANGLGHIGSSLYAQKFMAGVYSSPLLLAASAMLFVSARRARGAEESREILPPVASQSS